MQVCESAVRYWNVLWLEMYVVMCLATLAA
jgi:hypothetical protein